MATKIHETINYDMFELHEFNRDIHSTKDLERSMLEHGWIDAYPMHVTKNGNNKLRIKAGHHRFTTAKKLGIPVKYVVCDDNATITQLEKTSTKWTLIDYMESFARTGNKHFIAVKQYSEKTGIPVHHSASMLMGHSASSGNHTSKFKDGSYKISDDLSHANLVAKIVKHLQTNGIEFASSAHIVSALSKLCFVPEFNPERLMKKISTFPNLIKKQTRLDETIKMFEEVYNFHCNKRDLIPLAVLAKKTAESRCPVDPKWRGSR